MNSKLSGPLPLSISAAQPLSSDEQQQHQQQQHQLQQHNHRHRQEPELEPAQTIPRKLHAKKAGPRSHLSREAKAIRTRIRKLWQDPRHPENFKSQHGPKNQYLLLEESLTGILQIVPLIIENAKGTPPSLGHLHSVGFIEPSGIAQTPSPLTITINTAESSAGSTTALPSSPTLSGAPTNPPTNPSPRSSSSNPTTPARTHTRARTTSSNSASTVSATRYQIATSILQPPKPNLTDVAQPTVRTPTNISLLGEPALSTIVASAAGSPNPTLDNSSSGPQLAESNKILISKLLSLSNNFKGAIRTLYEQQNEKVLRFDDYMILDLLVRWEQEADKEVPDSELKDNIATSLVTLGATNALERYQITVGRVWEETEVILSSIRKIRDLVELGRIYHHNDFDADDSEEDAVERDEEAKRTLYSTLLYHANGLVTVLGEFLECVSGIQRLVGTIKTQRKSSDGDQDDVSLSNRRPTSEYNYGAQDTAMDFLSDEPRPIKHLDPALMRKLKRKTPFKSIADKVRRSFSDFAKRSTNQLLTIFPPLGDGTNDGFNWDSYSDNEYDSEEWAPTDMDSSVIGDEDAYNLALSPPDSPSVTSERPRHQLHRRLSSKDSSVQPEQYWPGSIRVGLSDDSQSPGNPSSPVTTFSTTGTIIGGQSMAMTRSRSSERSVDTINMRFIPGPDTPPVPKLPETASYFPIASESPASPSPSAKERRRSVQLFRKNSQVSNIKGAYISSPIPTAPRPFSVYSSGSESQTPSRHNYRVRPPKPPTALPPMPPMPTSTIHSSSYFKADEIMQDSANFKRQPSNKQASSYLATRSISPQQATPPTLESHFVRRTSIRMANRKRYSIKMPSDEISDQEVPDINNIPSSVFWRRRSYNDALEKSWQELQLETLSSNRSENSALSTPVTAEFAPGSRSSVRLSSFEFSIPYGPKDTKFNRLSSRSISSSPRSSLYSKYDNRRHSSPLTPSAENALAEALSHRASVPFRQSMQSSSPMSPNNRNSIGMVPTLNEDSAHKRHIPRPPRNIDQLNFVEVDSLNIPVRTRSYQRDSSFEGARINSKGPMQDFKDSRENDVQPTPETPQQPISPSRYNDMKRAWEILNLDVKRVNQYSDLRAYAKVNNAQNNSWAYSHPNAHQSTSRPHAIVIREKGEDVLILEKMDERLQVVAGVLENLIQRLADQNEQDGEYIQFEDFELNQELLKTLRKFLEGDVRKCGFVIEADCIEKNINIRSRSPKKNCSVIMEQGRFCLQRTRTRKISISKSQNRLQSPTYLGLMTTLMEPTPALPMEQTSEYGHPPDLLSTSPILSLTALELARYLTLADMKAFRCITVFELMSGWWKRRRSAESKNADDAEGSEHTDDGAIEAFTRRANMLSYWVAHEIVSLASTKHRKQLIKKFIEVAKICRDLSNLHTAMFIISALISPPVRRLHASWKMVSSTDMETLRELEKLFDFSGNMRYYRQIIGEAQAPMIPFLPILLKDITFILDGNPTMTTSKSYVDQTPLPVSGTATAAAEAVPTDPSVEVSSETSTSSLPTSPEKSGTDADKSSAEKGLLVNFEKFRQLTQYVENAVDMAKCLDYWFEPQLLRQAQVFRPTSPSIHCGTSNDTDSIYGSISSGRGGSNSPLDSSRGALDYVSEIVEHRLVKASGLYGAHQKIVEVEFSSKPKNTSLWKGVVNVGGIVSSGLGSGGSNVCTNGSSVSETVIRAVQGEEEYLMGLSLMCEPRS
ncbi:hypothetical protein BGX21_000941 [Mortierella sp. AD011]|nr:hypothetical protein BGX20_001058 [Mortierella sp. AD010]KAF9401683.1 hypothetical protein BGX21_000941 [Mortierella sp. AD011]